MMQAACYADTASRGSTTGSLSTTLRTPYRGRCMSRGQSVGQGLSHGSAFGTTTQGCDRKTPRDRTAEPGPWVLIHSIAATTVERVVPVSGKADSRFPFASFSGMNATTRHDNDEITPGLLWAGG